MAADGDPLDDGTVLIRDGKIVEVGRDVEEGLDAAEALRVFVPGRVVYAYPEGAVGPFCSEVRK